MRRRLRDAGPGTGEDMKDFFCVQCDIVRAHSKADPNDDGDDGYKCAECGTVSYDPRKRAPIYKRRGPGGKIIRLRPEAFTRHWQEAEDFKSFHQKYTHTGLDAKKLIQRADAIRKKGVPLMKLPGEDDARCRRTDWKRLAEDAKRWAAEKVGRG